MTRNKFFNKITMLFYFSLKKILEIDTKLKIHYKKTTKRLIRSNTGVILSKSGVILAKTGENVLTLLPQMARNTPLTEFFVEAI